MLEHNTDQIEWTPGDDTRMVAVCETDIDGGCWDLRPVRQSAREGLRPALRKSQPRPRPTGAGTGIGRAVARRFAAEGAKVMILGRTEETLREAAEASDRITYIVADLERDEAIDGALQETQQRFGQLDILVNNAGWAPVTPISDVKMTSTTRCSPSTSAPW